MERLSSCYFCGDAVDAAIEEYPLVVSEAYSELETDERIVLCPSCRRKLTTVIEHVLEAALNGDGEVDPSEIPPVTDEDVLIDVDGPSNGNGEPVTATDVDPLADDSVGDEPDADSGDRDDEESTWVQAGQTASDEDETSDAAPSQEDDEEQTTSSTREDVEEGSGSSSDAEAAETTTDHAFDRAEYNKIVKLLQNREFPVDIEEFTVVAQGAYRIDRRTTHEILDALIERGVIEDKGDHLVRT